MNMTASDTLDRRNEVFRALSDPTRRALFESLCRGGELNVADLTRRAGVSQPVVSKHLAQLKQARLVTDRPAGRQTFYAADLSALNLLLDWTAEMTRFWNGHLDRLGALLDRMDE